MSREQLVSNNEAAEIMKRSVGFICALKKVCGLHRVTRFKVSALLDYYEKNPHFRVQDVYPPKKASSQHTRGRKRQVARTSGARK